MLKYEFEKNGGHFPFCSELGLPQYFTPLPLWLSDFSSRRYDCTISAQGEEVELHNVSALSARKRYRGCL